MRLVGGAPVAGWVQRAEGMPETGSPWLVYFAVDDCDAAFAKATTTGGSAIVPPMDIPPRTVFDIERSAGCRVRRDDREPRLLTGWIIRPSEAIRGMPGDV